MYFTVFLKVAHKVVLQIIENIIPMGKRGKGKRGKGRQCGLGVGPAWSICL
jgi:hypothetical protein